MIKKGDMVIYESQRDGSRLPGIVLASSKAGSITVRWNDGSINVFGTASIVNDPFHVHFPA